jgi:hypothetical protein
MEASMLQTSTPLVNVVPGDEPSQPDWSEEDIVFLHWRLLQEIKQLSDPATPLEDKFDTLRWVFTERVLRPGGCTRHPRSHPAQPEILAGRVHGALPAMGP